MLTAAVVLFVVLLGLEWLFWLSPLTARFEAWTQRLYPWVPYHYLVRVLVLVLALWLWGVPPWAPFAGSWWKSLSMGLLLGGVGFGVVWLQTGGRLLASLRAWRRSDPGGFLGQTVYLLVGPALVEELLWRWFFMAALGNVAGYWVMLWAPLLNIVWHLPVWWRMSGGNRMAFMQMALPGVFLTFFLSFIYLNTTNIAGAVLAHWLADWFGQVGSFQPDRKQVA